MYIFCIVISLLSYIFFIATQIMIFSSLIIKILTPLFSLICLISGFLAFAINPGVVYSNKINNKKIYCSNCKFNYPDLGKRIEHCDICGICMIEVDHHCDVFGKCIAKRNLYWFYLFVGTTFVLIGLTGFTLLYLLFRIGKNNLIKK